MKDRCDVTHLSVKFMLPVPALLTSRSVSEGLRNPKFWRYVSNTGRDNKFIFVNYQQRFRGQNLFFIFFWVQRCFKKIRQGVQLIELKESKRLLCKFTKIAAE